MRNMAGAVFQSFSIFGVRFFWRGFSSWRDSFSYSPVFVMNIGYLLSFNPKTSIIEDSLGNKHSQCYIITE